MNKSSRKNSEGVMFTFPFDAVNKLISGLDGRVYIAFKHFPSGFTFFHDEYTPFHAASIIKLPVLAALYAKISKGEFSRDFIYELKDNDIVPGAGILQELHYGVPLTLYDLAVLMIVISDNSASNVLISLLGFDFINDFIRSAGMKDTALNKTFMTPLPPSGLFNVTTAYDMMIFLEKLYYSDFFDKSFTDEIFSIMCRQQYREKIPRFLPESLKIANKTGEVSGVRHDCGVVFMPDSHYALVICTSDLSCEWDGDIFIGKVSWEIYRSLSST